MACEVQAEATASLGTTPCILTPETENREEGAQNHKPKSLPCAFSDNCFNDTEAPVILCSLGCLGSASVREAGIQIATEHQKLETEVSFLCLICSLQVWGPSPSQAHMEVLLGMSHFPLQRERYNNLSRALGHFVTSPCCCVSEDT